MEETKPLVGNHPQQQQQQQQQLLYQHQLQQRQQQMLLLQQLQKQQQQQAAMSRFPSNIDVHLRPPGSIQTRPIVPPQQQNPNPNPSLGQPTPNLQQQQQQQQQQVATKSHLNSGLPSMTPSGKHNNVLGPDSAFKPTPPRRGFFAGATATDSGTPSKSNASGSSDPHASLFAEKSRQALLQSSSSSSSSTQQQGKGVLSKVSDAIFGW